MLSVSVPWVENLWILAYYCNTNSEFLQFSAHFEQLVPDGSDLGRAKDSERTGECQVLPPSSPKSERLRAWQNFKRGEPEPVGTQFARKGAKPQIVLLSKLLPVVVPNAQKPLWFRLV